MFISSLFKKDKKSSFAEKGKRYEMPPYRDDDQKSIKEETFTLKSRYIDEAKNGIRVAQYTKHHNIS